MRKEIRKNWRKLIVIYFDREGENYRVPII